MPYPVKPIPFDPRDYATHQSLLRVGAFSDKATVTTRQATIDYYVKAHALSLKDTKTLVYAPTLDQPGINNLRDIRIGPPAFSQDSAWLAAIVYHEIIHSTQFIYWESNGVTGISPSGSETERLMVALDELEAYAWTLKRHEELALSKTQQAELRRRIQYALIDLSDPTVNALAKRGEYNAARDELIRQYSSNGSKPAATLNKCPGCTP